MILLAFLALVACIALGASLMVKNANLWMTTYPDHRDATRRENLVITGNVVIVLVMLGLFFQLLLWMK